LREKREVKPFEDLQGLYKFQNDEWWHYSPTRIGIFPISNWEYQTTGGFIHSADEGGIMVCGNQTPRLFLVILSNYPGCMSDLCGILVPFLFSLLQIVFQRIRNVPTPREHLLW